MRKFSIILATILVLGICLTACGEKNDSGETAVNATQESASIQEETETAVDVSAEASKEGGSGAEDKQETGSSETTKTPETTKAPETTKVPETTKLQETTATKKNVSVKFLSWSYSSVTEVGNGYFIVKNSESEYTLINSSGKTVKSGIAEYKAELYKDAYLLKYSNGTQELYGATHTLIWSNTGDYSKNQFCSYASGILVITDPNTMLGGYIFVDVENGMKVVGGITDQTLNCTTEAVAPFDISAYNAGYFSTQCVVGRDMSTNYETDGYVQQAIIAVDKNGKVVLSHDYQGYDITPDSNGWTFVLDIQGGSEGVYVYNLKTGAAKACTYLKSLWSSGFRWKNFKLGNGANSCLQNGYMLVASSSEYTAGEWSIYNYLDDKVVATKFSYCGLDDYSTGRMLASKDGKWGYADKNFNVTTWYDDASDFNGGYALVVKSGKVYVINENMEIVSEAIDGVGVRISGNGFLVDDSTGKSRYMTISN